MKPTRILQLDIRCLTSIIFLLFLFTCQADEKNTAFATGFLKDLYTPVSFENLKADPNKYSGAQISVNGFLARDYDWVDTDRVPALYNKPFTSNGPRPGAMKIGIDVLYADALYKFGFTQKCTIYGVYLMGSHNSGSAGLFSFIRIDRIEGRDGKCLKLQFSIEGK